MKRFHLSFFVTALCVALFAATVCAQTKTIIIGEGVRGAMYLPAYIAEEKGLSRSATWIRAW
jgi:hypothetical protein